MQKYPEVYSLEKSLAILDKYKDELSAEQYEQNRSIICNHAIEGMFANEQDIIDFIKVDKGERTPDEIINEYKKSGAFYSAVENLNLIVKYQMYFDAAHRFFKF